jgi:putative ABC transport system permease protein
VITSREDFIKFNKRKDLSEEDADAIVRLCTLCWRIGIVANDVVNTKRGNQKNENVQMRAIKPTSTFDIDGVSLDAGRYWSDSEGDDAHEIAVVGADIVTNSFPGLSADQVVGQEIWAGGRPYKILGVLTPLGKILGASRDNIIYVPFSTYKKNFGVNVKRGAFSAASVVVLIQTQSAQQLEATEDQVRALMRNRRGKTFGDDDDGFALETQDVFLNLYSAATSNIYLVTIGVAAISLVVGGIVVMNIMLVSVTERTKEIGIRKAVGARQTDIRTQFLVEAVMVTAMGGAIGVLTGFGTAWLIALLIGFPLLVSIWSAILGVGVSSVVGVISGLWPAWRAARLDPIEALRAE